MARKFIHVFSSGVADIADTAQVLASDWNATHVLADEMTNRTGGTLSIGDVVAIDTANNESVVADDTQGKVRPYLVTVGAISGRILTTVSNLSLGFFTDVGTLTTKVTGVITRGNYLRKSATSKALEDTGVSSDGNPPPLGALAISEASDAGPGPTTLAVKWGGGLGGSSKLLLKAASANIPATGGATLVRVDATAETWYELQYTDASTQEATWELPAISIASIRITWRTSVTANNVKWFVEIRDKEDFEVLGSGTIRASGNVVDTAKAGSNQLSEASVTLNYVPGANKRITLLRVFRTPTEAADTLGATAALLYVELL